MSNAPAAPALTADQLGSLAVIADEGPRPGVINGNRLRWFEHHGLVTLERRGTGREVWTAATITELGKAALGRVDAAVPVDDEPADVANRETAALLADERFAHAETRTRLAELERRVAELGANGAALILELERYRVGKLVDALEQQRDHGDSVQLSAKVTGQFVALATLAGIDLGARRDLPPFRAEFAQAAAQPRPNVVALDELTAAAVEHVGIERAVDLRGRIAQEIVTRDALDRDESAQHHSERTVREHLAAAGVTVRRLLPGERVTVTEPLGLRLTRVLGELRRTASGQEENFYTAAGGTLAEYVRPAVLGAYLAAVRDAGCPAPRARRALLESVRTRG